MMAVEMHQTPMVNEPTVVEDLETGDIFHHPPCWHESIQAEVVIQSSAACHRLSSLEAAMEVRSMQSIRYPSSMPSPTVEVNQKVW